METTAKKVTLKDFLTDKQISMAIAIYNRHPENLHRQLTDKVIAPHMAEINRKLHQQNDADYLAYVLEYALMQSHAE